jgi:glucose uptake protein GlcU
MAKTIGLFALVALPVGFLLSSVQSRKQTEAEKVAFRRAGLDWDKRLQYPR